MLIGDIPMRAENRSGRPCDGLPGEELDDTYLRIAGLQRDEVYVSLVVQCRQEKGGQDQRPGEKLIQTCGANHLPHEIESVSPEVIVLMGAVTCNAIGIRDLDLTHGRPQYVESGAVLGAGWEGWVVPMYSAAAGMRDTRFMIPLLEDWTKLGQWLQGKRRVYPSLTKKRLDYRLLTGDNVWDHLVMQDESFYSHLPLDTESDEGRVWSLQFSPQPGQAYMIRADDDVALQAFRMWFGWNYEGRLLMHHAIHDLDELDQLRIKVREHRDTMQELYHLGHLPQGLKAAVYRAFGHRMISYRETVVPHSKAALHRWLTDAMDWAAGECRIEAHPPGPGCPTCGKKHRLDVSKSKPHEAEAVLRRVMSRVADPESDYDPWEKPKIDHGVEKPRLFGRPWMAAAEAAVGRMPRQSIVHVPMDEAVAYGCSDADHTGRLGTWLEGERKRLMENEWRVAA
jgi:uracil-DNA glycosylase family 4